MGGHCYGFTQWWAGIHGNLNDIRDIVAHAVVHDQSDREIVWQAAPEPSYSPSGTTYIVSCAEITTATTSSTMSRFPPGIVRRLLDGFNSDCAWECSNVRPGAYSGASHPRFARRHYGRICRCCREAKLELDRDGVIRGNRLLVGGSGRREVIRTRGLLLR